MDYQCITKVVSAIPFRIVLDDEYVSIDVCYPFAVGTIREQETDCIVYQFEFII
jgi:hypothetical protein